MKTGAFEDTMRNEVSAIWHFCSDCIFENELTNIKKGNIILI